MEDISASGGTFANSFFLSTENSFKSITPNASVTLQGQQTQQALEAGSVPPALIATQHMRIGIPDAQQAPAAGEMPTAKSSRFSAQHAAALGPNLPSLGAGGSSPNLPRKKSVLLSEGQVEVERQAGSRGRRSRSLEESREASAVKEAEAGVGGQCSQGGGGDPDGPEASLIPRSPAHSYKPQPSAVRASRRSSLLEQEQVNAMS